MLSAIGFIGSGSAVLVPNIVGSSVSSATSTLSAVGLSITNGGSTTSGATSGNDGTIASQSPSSGNYVDWGSSVTYVTYNYVPPCVPSYSYSRNITSSCDGCTYSWEDTRTDTNCGGGTISLGTGTTDCSSTVNTIVNTIDEVYSASSTLCFHKETTIRADVNSCTGAQSNSTYTYRYYTTPRPTPTSNCVTA